jgi:hypothetical protein
MANDYVSIGRRDIGTNLLGVKVIHNGDPRCTKRVGWRALSEDTMTRRATKVLLLCTTMALSKIIQ